MKYRKLGRSSLEVSEVGFGAWSIGTNWWGEVSEYKSEELLRRAFSLGINFFDTADAYGDGQSEMFIAKVLKTKRDKIVLSTKFGYDIYSKQDRKGHRERKQNFTPEFIRLALQRSLERLETDYIDLYQIHNPRMSVITDTKVFETLEDLRKEGKIRFFGVALGPAIGWLDEGLTAMKTTDTISLQTVYNLLEQEPGRGFFNVARERDVGILVRVPHASGLLDRKFTPNTNFGNNDHRSYRMREWLLKGYEKMDALKFLTEGKNRTLAQVAIKFALVEKSVSSVLPTITSLTDLEEYAKTSDLEDLTDDEIARINGFYENVFRISVPSLIA